MPSKLTPGAGNIFAAANSPAAPGVANAPPNEDNATEKGFIPYFSAPSCAACAPTFNNPLPIAPANLPVAPKNPPIVAGSYKR
jgi:hypothetical protein